MRGDLCLGEARISAGDLLLELKEVLNAPLHRDRNAWRGQGADQRVSPAFFTDRDFVTLPAPALGEANAELLED